MCLSHTRPNIYLLCSLLCSILLALRDFFTCATFLNIPLFLTFDVFFKQCLFLSRLFLSIFVSSYCLDIFSLLVISPHHFLYLRKAINLQITHVIPGSRNFTSGSKEIWPPSSTSGTKTKWLPIMFTPGLMTW